MHSLCRIWLNKNTATLHLNLIYDVNFRIFDVNSLREKLLFISILLFFAIFRGCFYWLVFTHSKIEIQSKTSSAWLTGISNLYCQMFTLSQAPSTLVLPAFTFPGSNGAFLVKTGCSIGRRKNVYKACAIW